MAKQVSYTIVVVLGFVLGCNGDEPEAHLTPGGGGDADTDTDTDTDTDADADADTGIDPTGDTGDHTTTDGPDWAHCAVASDNALRVVCSITDPARSGIANWTVTQGTRVRTASADVADEVVVWGLAPNTQLTWAVALDGSNGTGAFPTDPLPKGIASLQATVTGAPIETEAFAVPFTCDGQAGAAVFDAEGAVVWYHQEASSGAGVLTGANGLDWVDGQVMLGLGDRTLVEVSASGEEAYRLTNTDRPMHHDIAIGPVHRYALNASQHGSTVVDGFYVLDDAGDIIAEWDLANHVEVGTSGIGGFWLMEFPFAADWSHANSIEIDGPDHVLISLKHLNAILRVVSNPDRGDFGTIEWTLDGGRNSLPSDFVWSGGGAFLDQHHVSRRANGGLTIFDNFSQPQSRAIAVAIDEGAGTVTETGSWPFESRCAIQGSVYELSGGSILSLCSTSGTVREFPSTSDTPAWEVNLLCLQRSGGSGHLARAIPVDLPD